MYSEEQWIYIGNCSYCGAPCYVMDGMFRSTTDMDCRCRVEEEDEE